MDFNLSEEQTMLRDGAGRYLREHYDFESRCRNTGNEAAAREHWRVFAELGWLAMGIPEEYGGLGGSMVETLTLMEEFGRALVLEPYLSTAVLATRIVARAPNASLARELLPLVAEGRLRVALAHTEAGARYDLGRVARTQAREQGGGYVLDGMKMLVLDAPSADRLLVSAQMLPGEGFGLFAVDVHAAGLTLKPYRLIDGSRAADVVLEEVRVPRGALLVPPGQALAILEDAVDRATLAQLAEALGAMERVMEITGEYVKTRHQFGMPIGSFQALRHRLAEMFIEAQESRSALYCGLAHIDADPAQRRYAVSAAKAVIARAGKFVGGQGIQLHGGIGMTEEYPVGHYFRKLVAIEKCFGDIEHHLKRLAAAWTPA